MPAHTMLLSYLDELCYLYFKREQVRQRTHIRMRSETLDIKTQETYNYSDMNQINGEIATFEETLRQKFYGDLTHETTFWLNSIDHVNFIVRFKNIRGYDKFELNVYMKEGLRK